MYSTAAPPYNHRRALMPQSRRNFGLLSATGWWMVVPSVVILWGLVTSHHGSEKTHTFLKYLANLFNIMFGRSLLSNLFMVSSVCHWWVSFCPRAGAPHPEIIIFYRYCRWIDKIHISTGKWHRWTWEWAVVVGHTLEDSVVLKNAKNSLWLARRREEPLK